MSAATLTIGIDPTIELGPLSVAWHGLMIAVGLIVGGWVGTRYGAERGLDRDRMLNLIVLIVIAAMIGARVLFLIQNDDLFRPEEWFGTQGFSFYGAMIFGAAAGLAYLWRTGSSLRYLDALGLAFPFAMAVGRIGDLINGEHFGPESDLPWAIRYSHPDSLTPSQDIAYHPGGLYEIVLSAVIAALIWPLRDRFRRPGMLLATVFALYAVGRFVMFFWRDDTNDAFAGLKVAHLESIGLFVLAALAAAAIVWWQRRSAERRSSTSRPKAAGARAR